MSFNLLLNNLTIYDTIFISIKTVSNYPSLEDMKIQNPIEYELWVDFIRNRFEIEPTTENYLQYAPLYPEFSKIVGAGYGTAQNENGQIKRDLKPLTKTVMSEEEIIKRLTDMFNYFENMGKSFKPAYQHYICGYDLINFELPYYIKKFLKYNNNEKRLPSYIVNYITAQPWNNNIISTKDTFNLNSKTLFTNKDIVYNFLDIQQANNYIKDEDLSKYYWDNINNLNDEVLRNINLSVMNTINSNMQYMMKFRG